MGGAHGMALVIAQMLAQRGAILSLADVNEKGLQSAVKTLEGSDKHMYTAVDVRDSGQVDGWIQKTVDQLGRLDGAVNFAGICAFQSIDETTDDIWKRTMDINATGVFNCMRAQLRRMKQGAAIVSW